jgi:BirA family biotin operon repressor/biotin-[acetyl-CoA-carboxylase] ligase
VDIDRTQDIRDPRSWDDASFQRNLDALTGWGRGPVVIVDSTGSTNADVADQVRQGAPAGFAVVAHEQVRGRGRLDRTWQSPPGAGIAMSIAVRPSTPVSRWGWLPLLAGIAVVHACADAGLAARLKWPNDIVVTSSIDSPDLLATADHHEPLRKLGGILVERVDASDEGFGVAAVIGIGVNVDLARHECPTPQATSFRLEGHAADREYLVTRILDHVVELIDGWDRSGGDVLTIGAHAEYSSMCSTLGQTVRVERPGGDLLVGRAVSLHESGGLVIQPEEGQTVVVTAGDIVHLRQ